MSKYVSKPVIVPPDAKCLCGNQATRYRYGFVCDRCFKLEQEGYHKEIIIDDNDKYTINSSEVVG